MIATVGRAAASSSFARVADRRRREPGRPADRARIPGPRGSPCPIVSRPTNRPTPTSRTASGSSPSERSSARAQLGRAQRRREAGPPRRPSASFRTRSAPPARSRSVSWRLAQTTASNMRPRPRKWRQNRPNQRSIVGDSRDSAEPAIGISRERVGMHDQRPRRDALPAADHRRARPRRRGFDMVRLPRVEHPVQARAGRRNSDSAGRPATSAKRC